MGVSTVTVKQYQCDLCRKEIAEADWFKNGEIQLWSDRDVTARAIVCLGIKISYSTPPNVCCKTCAAKVLRQMIDQLEREVSRK